MKRFCSRKNVAGATIGLLLNLIVHGVCPAQEWADPPEDQAVWAGNTATFSVEPRITGMSYQWLRHAGTQVIKLEGQTNSSMTLSDTSIADVGYYFCRLQVGDQTSYSRAAALNLYARPTAGDATRRTLGTQPLWSGLDGDLTVYAPVVATSGTQGTCPGSYEGYASFAKTVGAGWGWAPSTNTTVHTATDANRTDTKVVYLGKYLDSDCAQTAVTVPNPAYSPKYRFVIYFPNNVPQTNAYAITLSGFDP